MTTTDETEMEQEDEDFEDDERKETRRRHRTARATVNAVACEILTEVATDAARANENREFTFEQLVERSLDRLVADKGQFAGAILVDEDWREMWEEDVAVAADAFFESIHPSTLDEAHTRQVLLSHWIEGLKLRA